MVRRTRRWLGAHGTLVFGILVLGYLLLPIAVVVGLSFIQPSSRLSFDFDRFTLDNWADP